MLNIRDQAHLDELKHAHDVLVVYFTTSFCGVGEALLPKVEALLQERDVSGALVNTTEVPFVGGQLLVLAVPTILVFVYGREFDRLSRHISVGEVEQAIDRAAELMQATD